MTARLVDIAAQAGVSPATVSRVLNGRSGVSDASRRSVLTAVDRLGYRRPTRLQSRHVGLIGLSIAELDNPIFAAFAQSLGRNTSAFGYSLLLAGRSLGVPAEEAAVELLQEHGVGGMIFVSGIHSDTTAPVSHYQSIRDTGMPLAFINGYAEGLDAIFVSDDDVVAMDLAVRHLAELGHTHLGLASGTLQYIPAARKQHGFRAAMQRHLPNGAAEEQVSDYSVEGGRASGRALIDRGCTAIIAGSDFMALGVIRAARDLDLHVPRDLSVIGYDGTPITAFTDPPLTTITQSIEAIAQAAVRGIVEEIDGSTKPRIELLFTPELVTRGSTGRHRG